MKYLYSDYHKVMMLREQGFTVDEISNITGVAERVVKKWIYREVYPYYGLEMIRKFDIFCRRESRIHKRDYRRLLRDPFKWPSIAYLYGAYATDGTLSTYEAGGNYSVRITGEKIFLERVNDQVEKILNKRYSIWKDKCEDRYITNITSIMLHNLMKLPLNRLRPVIEYSQRTMGMFILGIVDGDGFYSKNKRKIGFRKTKKWLVEYSKYILRKLGIQYRDTISREKGRTHILEGRIITSKKDRYGWLTDAYEFITKVGPTIKILKRNDLPDDLRNLLGKQMEM